MGLWDDVIRRINKGDVVPIISNSFRMEQLFREEKNAADSTANPLQGNEENLTIEEKLTKRWAEVIDYPLPDIYNLARVAQYFFVNQRDQRSARDQYLEFLKTSLLDIAQKDEESRDLAENLRGEVEDLSFSEIVRQLDYPKFGSQEDPLRLLARLPLPVYITTSHYDFLERALISEDKKPVTQVCFWAAGAGAQRKPRVNQDYEPDVQNPLVYHLFGLEDHTETMVLSEDDFMNFLVAMAQDNDTQNPILPIILQEVLANKTLLLLGYQLRDWDFRVLFRFIAKHRILDPQPQRGMIIQLKWSKNQIWNTEKSMQYLGRYFDKKEFDVEWSEAESFIRQLSDKWNEKRGIKRREET